MTELGGEVAPNIPRAPVRGTGAAETYFREAHADTRLFYFIIDTVLAGDWVAYVAGQALDGKEEFKGLDPAQLAKVNPGSRTRFLRRNRQALLEMFLSRLVDNFQKYLVDLIRTVLRSRPTMLSSSQHSLTLEELLQYTRIEDLVHDVIERKVNALSYEGFADLQAWCSDRGIPIQVSGENLDAVVELIATRNVIAHNRGVVDERYVRTVRSPRFQLGVSRAIEAKDLLEGLALLLRVVSETDEAAIHKFNLDSVNIAVSAEQPQPATAEPTAFDPGQGAEEKQAAEQGIAGDAPEAPP